MVGTYLDDVATVADAESGEALFTIGDGQGVVQDVKYSPDGQWIATAGLDATTRIWRADTGQQRFSMGPQRACREAGLEPRRLPLGDGGIWPGTDRRDQ